ncbi:MAG TPA: molybdopterin-dependent oxidoreductase [Syntrophomonadaceae bacterium]|nr:molybdopterin-dependent oxidoreductase [Syntrophomonadaceae bacterium]
MNIKKTCVILLIILQAAGCRSQPKSLGTAEIQSYQGQKLTSAATLPENSIKGLPNINIADYHLRVDGLVQTPQSYSYDQVLQKPQYTKLVVLHCVEGWDAKILWQGVKISDLIDPAVVDSRSNIIIFHSADGYTTSLPLDYVREKNILLAHKENEQVLPATLGYPFIVVAEDKYGYKWARWVAEIELSDNAQYKGYWEQRGYDNKADIPEK